MLRFTVPEASELCCEGGVDPLVGVVIKSVVIVEVQEISVWASLAGQAHPVFGSGGESSDGTSVVVIGGWLIRIFVLQSANFSKKPCESSVDPSSDYVTAAMGNEKLSNGATLT